MDLDIPSPILSMVIESSDTITLGEGDHKHYRDKEIPYEFRDLITLAKDFEREMEKYKKGAL